MIVRELLIWLVECLSNIPLTISCDHEKPRCPCHITGGLSAFTAVDHLRRSAGQVVCGQQPQHH